MNCDIFDFDILKGLMEVFAGLLPRMRKIPWGCVLTYLNISLFAFLLLEEQWTSLITGVQELVWAEPRLWRSRYPQKTIEPL